jgi:D-lactate dehydrogenase (cytochrome)
MTGSSGRPSPETIAVVTLALQRAFGNRCVTSEAMRQQHAHTTTWIGNQPPDIVVFAESAEDIRTVVKLCAEHKVPLIPFGAGSSLEGHLNAPRGGVSLDVSGMKKIIAVHPEDLDCVVEPGVTRKELNEYLKSYGLFFPIDPGADASIGGMASTRASGTNAVRYGTMKDNVIALEAILPNGETITTARRAKKTSAGYDLARLLIGSEGTLGVITKITLKLHGLPEAISAGVCPFPSVKAAADATIMTIQSGIPVARIELLDALQVKAVNLYSKLTLPESPLLLLEFHGSEQSVAEQAMRFGEIAAEFGGGPFDWATRPEDRTRLWQARHDSYWAVSALRPGIKPFATDICVPISHLAACIEETQADIAKLGLLAPIVGHVGDGNFHTSVLVDPENPAEMTATKGFLSRLVARAHRMEGTCTGEHGVGQGKMAYLEAELGTGTLDAMRAIKRALDPDNIMNPDKIFRL